jgi:hypothetical protein
MQLETARWIEEKPPGRSLDQPEVMRGSWIIILAEISLPWMMETIRRDRRPPGVIDRLMGKKIRGFDTEIAFGEMTSVRTLADVAVSLQQPINDACSGVCKRRGGLLTYT